MNSLSSSFREKVVAACVAHLDGRISDLQAQLQELMAGAESDSKSSAGDKHETGRAMMQLEHEGISRQLDGFLKEKNELAQLQPSDNSTISKGSLVKTNHGLIFLAVAMGKISIDSTPIITLSALSPLGRKLLGMKPGDSTTVNGVDYTIEAVI